MSSVEKVSCFPNEGTPEFIPGTPVDGDIVRVVGTQDYSRYYAGIVVAPTPHTLDGADWREYAYGVLGSIAAPSGTDDQKAAAGLTRYGQILKDGRAATDAVVIGAFDQYDNANTFRKDKVTIFLGVLNGTDPIIVTDAEFTAIIGNWPVA